MLVERSSSAVTFGIGDTVQVTPLKMNGKVVSFKNGKWQVELSPGHIVEAVTSELKRREVLLG